MNCIACSSYYSAVHNPSAFFFFFFFKLVPDLKSNKTCWQRLTPLSERIICNTLIIVPYIKTFVNSGRLNGCSKTVYPSASSPLWFRLVSSAAHSFTLSKSHLIIVFYL